ncbi:MAG: hypothetical protein QME54_01710 [Actinomycetota bacterium]|nr:hypothetical protein [Actinomycetota bacterium]
MAWECYKVLFQAKSPIHIGYGARLGFVNRTRYYIPAKNIWGALTSIIAKKRMKTYNPGIYEETGNVLKKDVRLSYFYIQNKGIPLLPKFTEKGVWYGDLSQEEFERRYISSIALTALEKSTRSAEEGSIHEIEFIKLPAKFSGYFFINLEAKDFQFKAKEDELVFYFNNQEVSLSSLQVGGEHIYGFGKIELIGKPEIQGDPVNLFNQGSIKVDLGGEEPLISLKAGESYHVLAPLSIKDLQNKILRMEGDLEPLVGREWGERGAGQEISEVKIISSPGTTFELSEEVVLGIKSHGIWEFVLSDHYRRFEKKYGMSWEEFERKMKEGEIVPPKTDSLELYEWHSDTIEWEFYAKANREGA